MIKSLKFALGVTTCLTGLQTVKAERNPFDENREDRKFIARSCFSKSARVMSLIRIQNGNQNITAAPKRTESSFITQAKQEEPAKVSEQRVFCLFIPSRAQKSHLQFHLRNNLNSPTKEIQPAKVIPQPVVVERKADEKPANVAIETKKATQDEAEMALSAPVEPAKQVVSFIQNTENVNKPVEVVEKDQPLAPQKGEDIVKERVQPAPLQLVEDHEVEKSVVSPRAPLQPEFIQPIEKDEYSPAVEMINQQIEVKDDPQVVVPVEKAAEQQPERGLLAEQVQPFEAVEQIQSVEMINQQQDALAVDQPVASIENSIEQQVDRDQQPERIQPVVVQLKEDEQDEVINESQLTESLINDKNGGNSSVTKELYDKILKETKEIFASSTTLFDFFSPENLDKTVDLINTKEFSFLKTGIPKVSKIFVDMGMNKKQEKDFRTALLEMRGQIVYPTVSFSAYTFNDLVIMKTYQRNNNTLLQKLKDALEAQSETPVTQQAEIVVPKVEIVAQEPEVFVEVDVLGNSKTALTDLKGLLDNPNVTLNESEQACVTAIKGQLKTLFNGKETTLEDALAKISTMKEVNPSEKMALSMASNLAKGLATKLKEAKPEDKPQVNYNPQHLLEMQEAVPIIRENLEFLKGQPQNITNLVNVLSSSLQKLFDDDKAELGDLLERVERMHNDDVKTKQQSSYILIANKVVIFLKNKLQALL
jgi:hypothetical protein